MNRHAHMSNPLYPIDFRHIISTISLAEGNISGPSKEVSAAAAQIAISNSLAAGNPH